MEGDDFDDFDAPDAVQQPQQQAQVPAQSPVTVAPPPPSAAAPSSLVTPPPPPRSTQTTKMEDPEEMEEPRKVAPPMPKPTASSEDFDAEVDEEAEAEEKKPMVLATTTPPAPQSFNWGGASATPDASQQQQPLTPQQLNNVMNVQIPNGPAPILQNVVSTVSLGTCVDLKRITAGARNAEYNPKRFAAVIMRIREPKATALIFASGKIVCTGARTETESKHAAKKFARIIQKLGYPEARFIDFKVQNMVASCDMKFPIKLEALALNQPLVSSYEPELFPGLIFRMLSPKLVLLIFVSGKIVITGAKTMPQIFEAVKKIYPVLMCYKKSAAPGPS